MNLATEDSKKLSGIEMKLDQILSSLEILIATDNKRSIEKVQQEKTAKRKKGIIKDKNQRKRKVAEETREGERDEKEEEVTKKGEEEGEAEEETKIELSVEDLKDLGRGIQQYGMRGYGNVQDTRSRFRWTTLQKTKANLYYRKDQNKVKARLAGLLLQKSAVLYAKQIGRWICGNRTRTELTTANVQNYVSFMATHPTVEDDVIPKISIEGKKGEKTTLNNNNNNNNNNNHHKKKKNKKKKKE